VELKLTTRICSRLWSIIHDMTTVCRRKCRTDEVVVNVMVVIGLTLNVEGQVPEVHPL